LFIVVAQQGFEWPGVVHRFEVGGIAASAVPAGTAAGTGAANAALPPTAPATPIIPTAVRTTTDYEHLAEKLAVRLGRREITLARYDAATTPLDKRLAELCAELAALDTSADEPVPPEAAAASLAERKTRWGVATIPERRNLLRRALRSRRLLVMPADRHGPRRFDPERIVIDDGMAGFQPTTP
jgi:hypothetical protein